MSGIDPALASALASRIDVLLQAVSSATDAKQAQAVEGAEATQWANAQPTATPDTDAPPPASAQAVLSQTARTLDVIARGADGEPAPPVVGRQALWSNAPGVNASGAVNEQAFAGLASSLAMALEQALDTSGLFYESHLAQWLTGQRSTALLSQEPQSRLPGATDEEGFAYDAEAALRQLAQAPLPFTGRASPGFSDSGDETDFGTGTVDVEFDEPQPANTAFAYGAGPQNAAATPGQPMLAGPAGMLAHLVELPELLAGDGGIVRDADDDAAPEAPAGESPAGTALVAGARGESGAMTTTTQATQGRSASSSAGNTYSPTPGSTLFANAGNAAYAAQAVLSRNTAEVYASAADRAVAAGAENNPTLQANSTPVALPVHPDALSIVRQQLDLLQSAEPRFRWSGEAWPDSRMYWELDWDPDDQRAASQRVWRTRIAIELPTLGLVDAELTLNGHRLAARITANGTTLGTLKDGTSDFMRALAGAGLNLEQLAIRKADAQAASATSSQDATGSRT